MTGCEWMGWTEVWLLAALAFGCGAVCGMAMMQRATHG